MGTLDRGKNGKLGYGVKAGSLAAPGIGGEEVIGRIRDGALVWRSSLWSVIYHAVSGGQICRRADSSMSSIHDDLATAGEPR